MKNFELKRGGLMPLNLQFFAGEGGDGAEGGEGTETQKNETEVDTEKVKNDAINDYLKLLGVETDEDLKNIVTKHKEAEDKNKTEVEKQQGTINTMTKELSTEKNLRLIAEAKLSAIKLGANPDLVDDLVVVAMSKVTKDKDVNAVIAEIKAGNTGKIYFPESEEETEDKKKSNVTRKRVTKQNDDKNKNKEDESEKKHEGTMAERLLQNKGKKKSHWFK